jgi:hypothetical protein
LIYFAQTPTGSIKIGCTENLDVRLDQLRAHYGAELALLATMPGDRSTEAEIHGRFAHLRFGRSEQFKPARELMEFIGKPLLVGADPEMVEAAPRKWFPPGVAQIERDILTRARKIDLADEVLILNVGGYIGDSTRREIAYARARGKKLRWLEVPEEES